MNAETARAGRVGAASEIRQVRLVSLEAALSGPSAETFFGELKLSYVWSREQDVLVCEATAELVVRETEEPGPDTFRAVVTYGAAYALIEGPDFEDADFEAFAQIVGAFNLHPYLRECLHSTMARCGLPPLVLPPLKSPLPTEDARAAIDAAHFEEESRKP